jgi:hypothetical protein
MAQHPPYGGTSSRRVRRQRKGDSKAGTQMALIGMTSTAATAVRPATRRRSRAKARPPRAYAVICAELRGLGGLVLEQALLDGTEAPLASLCEWADRLASELGVEGVGVPPDYRGLLHAIVEMNKRAEARHSRLVASAPARTGTVASA